MLERLESSIKVGTASDSLRIAAPPGSRTRPTGNATSRVERSQYWLRREPMAWPSSRQIRRNVHAALAIKYASRVCRFEFGHVCGPHGVEYRETATRPLPT